MKKGILIPIAIVLLILLAFATTNAYRVPTVEIMRFTPTIVKLILEGKDNKLPDAIRIGAEEGMQDRTAVLGIR